MENTGNVCDTKNICDIFVDKKLKFSTIPKDLHKLITAYILTELNIVENILKKYYIINNVNNNNNDINNNDINNNEDEILYSNYELLKSLWLKYISSKLPKNSYNISYNNFLKLFIEAFELYKIDVFNILLIKDDYFFKKTNITDKMRKNIIKKKYDIIIENSKALRKLQMRSESKQNVNDDEINGILRNIVNHNQTVNDNKIIKAFASFPCLKIIELFINRLNINDINEFLIFICDAYYKQENPECKNVIKLLISKGADIKSVFLNPYCLELLEKIKRLEFFDLGYSLNNKNIHGNTFIYEAFKCNQNIYANNFYNLAIECGLDIYSKNNNNQTFIDVAVAYGMKTNNTSILFTTFKLQQKNKIVPYNIAEEHNQFTKYLNTLTH